MTKYVYFFGGGKAEGRGDAKDLLGGKGAGLAEMTRIGLPVPAGFTITTEACAEYYERGKKFPPGLDKEVRAHLARLEKTTKKRLGDAADPLLVSVRSGAARSMPGMMETILNLGLNDRSVEGLAKRTSNPRFAYDAYRRFITMYGATAMGVPREELEHVFADVKVKRTAKRLGVALDSKMAHDQQAKKVNDPDVSAEEMKEVIAGQKAVYRKHIGKDFPQDPIEQLWGAVGAVFGSWNAEKAQTYRKVEKITGLKGTAVNVVQMVFGNKGERSGTGVCFTRDPNTGENVFYGDLLINAQGEDVVAGIRTPVRLSELEKVMPKANRQLYGVRKTLEAHYKEMQDLEFTIEDEVLYMLQCRTGKRSPRATFKIAFDMVKEKLITRDEALGRITSDDIERLFYPVIDPKIPPADLARRKLANGIDAVPGAAAGKVVFTAAEAEAMAAKGEKVLLVRKETSPEDVGGMHAAQGILTATGGKTSHAAVVARGWGKCCIVGCEKLSIDYGSKQMSVGGRTVKQGDWLTLNGSDGEVYEGELPLVKPELPAEYHAIMRWADERRTIGVRTNADTPYDSKKAREMGAEGIGLCRTEHMFFDTEERRLAIQEMIVAETREAREKALAKLLPIQRADFAGIFEAMDGLPVTVRLIDPPLHEFVPHDEPKQRDLASRIGVPYETVKFRVEQLHEANPMLGHRGCRLCITYPEILEMQVRAILEAAVDCRKKGIESIPEIMIPLTMAKKEFEILEASTRRVAEKVFAEKGAKVPYLVGTMIEIPRAALVADQIAERAEFFSFGTNDLTQMTMGLSRDDAGRFLPDYVDEKKAGVFAADPFQSLDQEGVGQLVSIGIERGRRTRKDLKIGICGEHGGESASVKFCHRVGMNYVSCSPYRVPIARLAAAQAAIEEGGRRGKPKKAKKPSKKARK